MSGCLTENSRYNLALIYCNLRLILKCGVARQIDLLLSNRHSGMPSGSQNSAIDSNGSRLMEPFRKQNFLSLILFTLKIIKYLIPKWHFLALDHID